MAPSLLVLGGARSGKSRFAIADPELAGRIAFVGTAEAGDADMARRIARHRAERPAMWTTVEAPVDLISRLHEVERTHDAVIVDCLTLWVANRLGRGDDDTVLAEADRLAALVRAARCRITLVSNEVGGGVHPDTEIGRRFRDVLGLVNQRVAAACDRVVLMVAGLPLVLKAPAEVPRADDGDAVQAP